MTTPVRLPAPPRRWIPRNQAAADAGTVAALTSALNLPEPLCRLLASRGYADPEAAKRFLRPRRDQLLDPFAMAGMEAAVKRLRRAIRDGQRILVHGDYDVDGICAAALYTRTLRRLGGHAEPFVPHRIRDGYDLGPAGLRAAAAAGAALVLTADCGIVAHDAVAAAVAGGLDVIVTDHHAPGARLPDATAVVNPHRHDCEYPFKALAGTGVAFKVCQALHAAMNAGDEALRYDLDLVGLATIADVVPLVSENRVLAHFGLRVLAQSGKPGLRALIQAAGLGDRDRLAARHVSHVLAPRINAAGRVGEPADAVRLMLEEEAPLAEALAGRLETANERRREVEARTLAQALEQLESSYDPERDYAVVLAGEDWHPGVIGIVASRVVERIHRPAVLVAKLGEELGRGSARSIRGFDIVEALRACAGLLDRYGGHRYAAGLELRLDRLEPFRDALNQHAHAVLEPGDLRESVEYDLELSLDDAGRDLARFLEYVGPFGMGNPTPIFAARSVSVAGYPRVVGSGHARLRLARRGAPLDAIGFGLADRLAEIDTGRGRIDVAFQLQLDEWQGRERLQARLVDLRPTG